MATAGQIVERVRKLLELAAANENTNEARASAVKAAKLIKQYGLVVCEAAADAAEEAIHEHVHAHVTDPPRTQSDFERAVVNAAPKIASSFVERLVSNALSGKRRRRR